MRILKASASNFASFKTLDFRFEDGLTLLYGPTGAGKSTLLDLVSWTLYGETSKDGTADSVKSWDSAGVTEGKVEVETHFGRILVIRTRGTSKQNDLYWYDLYGPSFIYSGPPKRGKDVTETERLLEERLMVSSSAYHSGCVYNDSSISGKFFMAKAKERKSLLEQIASLSFPVKLNERLVKERHTLRAMRLDEQHRVEILQAELHVIKSTLAKTAAYDRDFEETKRVKIANLQAKMEWYEKDRTERLERLNSQIQRLKKEPENPPCPTCGAKGDDTRNQQINRLEYEIEKCGDRSHQHDIKWAEQEKNPYTVQFAEQNKEKEFLARKLKTAEHNVALINGDLQAAERLLDLTNDLKALLLTQATSDLQTQTNSYLETYFDSELRITFEVDGPDNLDVVVHKDGHSCSYAQLSKGQRSLLKLCFALSVMKVSSNRIGITNDTIFLDEPFDGCDPALKLKGFNLLQALNLDHKSIYVIDHEPSFQELFGNKILVSLIGNNSYAEAK